MKTPLLEIKDLKKYFSTPNGLLHAVDNVNMEIYPEQTLGIVGESGCGKTTLGRLIMQLVEATDGEVLFEGQNILGLKGRQKKEIYKDIQMIFQDPFSSLNPRLTVGSIIEDPLITMGGRMTASKRKEKVLELMDIVGLPEHYYYAYPHELDGGRRQRIGIARALALEPKLIICDEPVSALDVSIQAQILNLLMDLQETKHMAYMFITHNLLVVKHISHQIAVMYMGQVVEYTSKEELFANPRHPYTKALINAIPMPDLSVRQIRRNILKGEITNPINPAPGCRFASRCEYACERCRGCDIALKEVSKDHYVACACVDEIT